MSSMDFSEFEEVVGLWCDQRPATPLDCWVDDANARLEVLGSGVRCSIELLDPYDTNDPQRIEALLSHGGASLACACDGAFAIDPQTSCMVLVSWIPDPCSVADLLNLLESLANQRAALLSLMHTTLVHSVPALAGRTTLNNRQPGV
ncbi:type III secretion system chaperone HrpG [Pseudomonas cannabina]|uniref:HrpG n=6 Tax=Pseudomonas syringae group TaxID=136849 RepID=I0BVX1_PSECA|nr:MULTISPECIES: type III secretion protein [Pseudomonas syringae group]AFH66569.1 HrpG [Pseudomonas cannabina]KPB77006.1 HrpG [Pseudomonas syringae pv. maculicola]KPC25844.1 HrpG [Pseudomonas syringae pv. cilantro]KPW21082.1 HrpG [Pseudomonas cannabina pv. alisalensis]MBM0138993.1 type III secretion protein [Pseudomonas cannabina pv. alisalensis]